MSSLERLGLQNLAKYAWEEYSKSTTAYFDNLCSTMESIHIELVHRKSRADDPMALTLGRNAALQYAKSRCQEKAHAEAFLPTLWTREAFSFAVIAQLKKVPSWDQSAMVHIPAQIND